jgi:hypothetical protein
MNSANEQVTCNIVKQIHGYRVATFRDGRYVGAVDFSTLRKAVEFANDRNASCITVRIERRRGSSIWHKIKAF